MKSNSKEELISLISELKEENLQLREKSELAYKSQKDMEMFTYALFVNLSHEIRTPLNAIVGFSELMNSEEVSLEKRTVLINHIETSANRLLSVLDDKIDKRGLMFAHIKLDNKQFKLNNLIEGLRQFWEEKTLEKDLELKTYNDLEEGNDFINADRLRLEKILSHLISNALKYTNEGVIEIGYKFFNSEGITFYVKDTGIGIKRTDHELIFNRLMRGESLSWGAGLGLDLPTCSKLVELMKGKIWLESDLGKGATFFFTIPYIKY